MLTDITHSQNISDCSWSVEPKRSDRKNKRLPCPNEGCRQINKREEGKERMRKKSRETLLKRGCSPFVWDILLPGMETRWWCWVWGDLKRQQDEPQGTSETGIPAEAQLLVPRTSLQNGRHIYMSSYCPSISIKHITKPNKPFGLSPRMTIHPIALLQLHSWWHHCVRQIHYISFPGFCLSVCFKSCLSFFLFFLIIKYSKYIS